MRALVITFILVVATPHTSLAQGDAAMAAARAATGSQVGKPAASKPKAATPPAAPAEKPAASEPAADAPAPVVATPADAAASPALQARGFAYNPEGRRDPFVNLLRRGTGVDQSNLGPRPSGLKGLGTGEVTLKGTMASKGAYVAIKETQREVRKVLRQTEEAK
jgi:hypothetical protein